jgi:hypothetical protein
MLLDFIQATNLFSFKAEARTPGWGKPGQAGSLPIKPATNYWWIIVVRSFKL